MKKIISNNKNAFVGILALLMVGAFTMAFEDSPFMRLKFPDTQLNTDTVPQKKENNNLDRLKDKENENKCKKLCESVSNHVFEALKKIDFDKIGKELDHSLKGIDKDKLKEEINSSIKGIDWKEINATIHEAIKEAHIEIQKAIKEIRIEIEKAQLEMKKEPI